MAYHLNLKTGEPGVCRAKPGNCPLAAAGDHFDSQKEAQEAYEDRMANETVPVNLTRPSNDFSNLFDHADMKTIVPEIMAKGQGLSKPTERWYGIHAGRMNPTNGDGDDYGHWGSGDSVILGERDGKRVRVISGSGGVVDPEEDLGQQIILTKQQINSKDTETHGLYVLGRVSADGTKTGWVPDKRIHYFVFK